MWPWEHLAFAYLVYSLGSHASQQRPPGGTAVVLLATGSLFPDLVDKPLAWWLGVLPSGRSAAHSALVAAVLVAAVVWCARRWSRAGLGWAFGIGYVLHLLGDCLAPLRNGTYSDLSFLLYPLLSAPVASGQEGAWPKLSALATTASQTELSIPLAIYLAAFALTAQLWVYDGSPGVAELRSLAGGR